MDLTILIPVKNEEDNISNIIYNIEKKLFNLNYEVLFVNDFSTDKTVEIINNYKNLKKNIEIVHNKKEGLGEAIKNGIKFSKGEYLSIIMCDGSDDIDDLKKYIEIIKKENLDAVFGSRFLRNSKIIGYPKFKLILNRIFNYFVSFLYINKYNDFTNAFKIYKKASLLEIEPIVSESFNVFLELPLKIINRRYKYRIIPINWLGREQGVSKFKFNELRSKYIFTLIYCFAEKILLLNKKNKIDK